jgi:hypothetical protein
MTCIEEKGGLNPLNETSKENKETNQEAKIQLPLLKIQ